LFKSCAESPETILNTVQLGTAANKPIRYFSSGMKQRLKLALAFFSQSDLLLLDEPLTNLDAAGAGLYNHLIENIKQQRVLIISSNDQREYAFCTDVIDIRDLKGA
jgi:ABC-type multidrug transport system ATPase subunit